LAASILTATKYRDSKRLTSIQTMSEIKITNIDRVHRVIYLVSLITIALGLFAFILGFYFLDNFKSYLKFGKIVEFLIGVTPFAPIGTLFGILKESQTTRKKLVILSLTGLSVVFLLIFIWGSLFAAAFD
jgi:hypothetical protein